MLLVPFFLKRFGMKLTLLIGMLAWAARYVLFAYGNAGELVFMLILGIALHGVCYDFFFVSGQVFTDSKAGPRYKSAAQGLITLATYGVGMLIGFWVAGQLTDAFAVDGGHDWRSIWLYPAGFAAAVAVVFALLFRNEVVAYKPRRRRHGAGAKTMASYRYHTVDVFTATPLKGNALAVVHDAVGLSDATMQQFAHWTNLSETTFLLPPTNPKADYRVRIFFPNAELPFAGHPTLGSCHAWLAAGGKPRSRDEIVQECGVGLVRVRRDGKRLAFAAPPLRRSGDVDAADAGRGHAQLRYRAQGDSRVAMGRQRPRLGRRHARLARRAARAEARLRAAHAAGHRRRRADAAGRRGAVRDARLHRGLGPERGSGHGQPAGGARAMADRRRLGARALRRDPGHRASGATAASTSRSAATMSGSAATA